MRILAIALAALAFEASAFNSAEWLEKRSLISHEADRLRLAYSNCTARVTTPAEDITVPVETFDDGSVKTVVQAKRAQYFLEEGFVWGSGVVVKKYKEDGRLEVQLEADACVVDRMTKSGWAEGHAKVTHGKTVFQGRGVYFSSPESYVKVVDESEVESSDLKFGGLRP